MDYANFMVRTSTGQLLKCLDILCTSTAKLSDGWYGEHVDDGCLQVL